MGLFSSKRKTYVNTSISRMIADVDIPDLGTTALYDYLFSDKENRNSYVNVDRSYATSLRIAHSNSIATKLAQARNWALNNYTYGVPEGNILDPDQVDIRNVMDEYLTRTLGKPIRIGYAKFGPTNALHMAWQLAVDALKYNPDTNETVAFSEVVGSPTYLSDIQVEYSTYTTNDLIDPETVAQYGLAATHGKTYTRARDDKRQHTPFITSNVHPNDMVRFTLSYLLNGNPTTISFTYDLLKYEWSGAQPTGVLDDSDTENYEPEAEAPSVVDDRAEHDYIMVQYFIQNDDLTESIGYFTYKYGSGEIRELDELFTVKTQLGRHYPNIYIRLDGKNLAADKYVDTDDYKSSKKLCTRLGLNYKKIADQIHESVGSVGDVVQILISTQLQVNSDDPLIQDYMYEYFYALYNQLPDKFADTGYSSLNTDYVNGYAKTNYTSRIKDEAYENSIQFNTIGYLDEQKVIGEVGTVAAGYSTKEVFNRRGFALSVRSVMPIHTFTKQITETTCRTMRIYGLSSTQVVRGGYTTTAGGDDENLILPLDDAIARDYSYAKRSTLYSKSLTVILNTIKVVKTKWYQTGIFKAIMFVIAVAVSVFTGGAGMSLYAIAYAVAQTLVVGMVINLAIKFLVNTLNVDIGAIFAIVAVVLIIAGAGAYISEAGTVMSMTAPQLMQVANYSIMVSSHSNDLEMKKMVEAHSAYGDRMKQEFDELTKLQEELNVDNYLSPYYLLSDSVRSPDIRVGEIMNDFITRTLSTNIGTGTTAMISNLFELTVRLPTLQETIAKIQRGSYGNTV